MGSGDGDDSTLDGGHSGDLRRAVSVLVGGLRRTALVLGPDIAAIDAEAAIRVDADEHAGTGDLRGIVAHRRSSKAASAVSISPRRVRHVETSYVVCASLILS